MNKPKILLYDIETAPNLAYVWGKYEQDVIAYKDQWHLLSFAYKWFGKKSIYCKALCDYKDKTDESLVKDLWKLFNEADILIAHNGDEFDQKKAKARFVYYKLNPTKVLTSIDTKKVAKKYFNFNSNSLQDLGEYLKLGSKVKHPGFDLWLGCLKGEKKSWNLMIKYNKQDVRLLERIYKRFLPWIEIHPNLSMLSWLKKDGCPKCGNLMTRKKGVRANSRSLSQQWQCQSCMGWFLTPLKGLKCL